MSDPLQRIADQTTAQPRKADQSSLFNSTSRNALAAAAPLVGNRRARILQWITDHGPSTLFEIAAGLGVFDHQISGRFSELESAGLIYRTGERRRKPETQCDAEVYALRDQPPGRRPDLADAQGYPSSLQFGDDGIFDRDPVVGGPTEPPGIPYSRRSSGSVPRVVWWVQLVECEGCGKPLNMVVERVACKDVKVFRCGTPTCNRTWHLTITREPGQPELLALVMKTL